MKSQEMIQKALELNKKRHDAVAATNSNPYLEGLFEGYFRAFEWILAQDCEYIDELVRGKGEIEDGWSHDQDRPGEKL